MTCAFSEHALGTACGVALGLLVVAVPATAQLPTPQAPRAGRVHAMEVMGVAVERPSGQPMVILRSREDRRELIMSIGPFEAQGIALPLQGQRPPRPYTHDLIVSVLRRLNASVVKVVINDLRDNTYFATIFLRSQGREIELDSRPSDAIALALRENVPILAEERVFHAAPQGTETLEAPPR